MPKQPEIPLESSSQRPTILDGATGTELERRGVATPAPLWSAAALRDAPDAVAAIHRDYVDAGADVLVANTFRTNPRALRAAGREADGIPLNCDAVALARSAAASVSRQVLVAASVAPVEDCYCPERVPEADQLRDEHGRMLSWLAEARPDLIWIETMGTVREARAAAEAAAATSQPPAVSFVLREDGSLLGGEALEDALAAIDEFDPAAVGLNCIPPAGITSLLPRLRKLTPRPIAVYAHIGNRNPIPGWTYVQESVTPDEYADHARRWRDLGADIIGGCCGTTPAHIAAIAGELRE